MEIPISKVVDDVTLVPLANRTIVFVSTSLTACYVYRVLYGMVFCVLVVWCECVSLYAKNDGNIPFSEEVENCVKMPVAFQFQLTFAFRTVLTLSHFILAIGTEIFSVFSLYSLSVHAQTEIIRI